MLPLIPLAIAAAPSIIKGVSGLIQSGKGNRLAKKNIRPTYEIPKEFQQNLAIADQMAQGGLPQQQYNQAQQGFQRNQAAALRQFGRMGNPRGLAGIVRARNDATLGLDVTDAQARMENQRQAMGYRNQIGQQQLAKQQWDKFGKYQENADAAAALQGAGRQNTFGALSDLSQLGQMAMTGGAFGQGGGGAGSPASTGSLGVTGQSWMGGLTNPAQVGQYGTRLGGMAGVNNIGANYGYPRNQFPSRFSPKFIPQF